MASAAHWTRNGAAMLAALALALPLASLGFSAAQGTSMPVPLNYLRAGAWNSLALIICTGLATAVMGTLSAWCVTMCRFPGRKILAWALFLPFALPAYVSAYAWASAADPGGPLSAVAHLLHLGSVRNFWGMVFVFSFAFAPYVYIAARTAFLTQSVCAYEAARSLGCTAFGAFWRIALPMARPAIVAGVALVGMETLADYGVAAYFGVPTWATASIRAWLSYGDIFAAARLALGMALMAGLLLVFERHSRHHAAFDAGRVWRRLPEIVLSGWRAWSVTAALSLIVILGFIAPLAILAALSLQTVTDWSVVTDAVLNTAVFAGLGTVGAVGAGLLLHSAHTSRSVRAAGFAAKLAYAIPGSALAVGLLIPASLAWRGAPPSSALGTLLAMLVLVYAYAARFLAASSEPIDAGMKRLGASIGFAARTLGLRADQVFWRVRLPAARAAVLAACALVFTDILKELPATLILRPAGMDTLATLAHNFAADERIEHAAVPALLLVALALGPVVWLSRQLTLSRPGAN